ncbi:MAG: exo-alpha-sialidase, partial [Anaerolineales bacterium]
LEHTPSGRRMLYVPCPGGQMKFHVLYDAVTQLYWLLSTQATDSMVKPERMAVDRFNLPNNERQRLQLHFSKDMVNWCFAGLVAVGPVEKASRHYASMAFDGDDLVILSRSGDGRAKSPHDGNLITFHRVVDFRRLVY